MRIPTSYCNLSWLPKAVVVGQAVADWDLDQERAGREVERGDPVQGAEGVERVGAAAPERAEVCGKPASLEHRAVEVPEAVGARMEEQE